MHFINLLVNYLDRKYRVPINFFFENLTRGTSYLRAQKTKFCNVGIVPFQYQYIIKHFFSNIISQGLKIHVYSFHINYDNVNKYEISST